MFRQRFVLTLKPSLILEAVKAETFIKGKVDKGALNNAEAMVFNEQAGDDVFHERKLTLSIYNAVEELCSVFSEYVSPDVLDEEPSISHNIDMAQDEIKICLSLSYRVNPSFTTTISRLAQQFIVNKVTYDWFLAFEPKLAQVYVADRIVANIRICFNRRPPLYPHYPYVHKLICGISEVSMNVGDSYNLSYSTIGGRNDIVYSYTGKNLTISHNQTDKVLSITADQRGVGNLYLYSKHDDSIYTTTKITVDD
mgnify:CR=1 FL=1